MEDTTVIETDEVVEEEVVDTPETTETEKEPAKAEEEADKTGYEESEEEDTEEEAVEYDEFDFGGEKFTVPKGELPDDLKERLDKFTKGTWSDYTKKSQAVAEQAKSLEARESAVQKLQGLQGEAMSLYSKGLQVREELAQLNQIKMDELWQSNTDQARQVSDLKAAKQAEFDSIVGQVDQKDKEATEAQVKETARREAEGRRIVERSIPGFGAKAPEVIEFAVKEYGVSKAEAENWGANPVAAVALYESMLYRRMKSKVSKGKKPAPAPAVPIKPIKGKGAKAKVDPSKMSPEEYANWWRKTKEKIA